MPESVSFIVSTYYKLAKGETGLTNMATRRVDAGTALTWILNEIPDEALTVTREPSGENGWDIVSLRLDCSKVPDSVRLPKLPAARRR